MKSVNGCTTRESPACSCSHCYKRFSLAGKDSLKRPRSVNRFDIPSTDEGLPGSGPIRRYGWFKSLWKSKRTKWANDIERDQGAVVFLGDSITQGWGPDMGNSFPGVKVANRGISGDTTRGVLIRLKEDVLSLNPSGVVLLIGTNDLEEGAEPETISSNLTLILANLKQHNPKMPIILCRVFPSSASKKRSADDIKKVNELYARAIYGDHQVTMLDTWTLFANEQGDAKKEEFPDLLHPNKLGYAKWAAALRPLLATLRFIEQDADRFQVEPGYTSLFNGYDFDGWRFLPSTEQQRKARARWKQRDANAPPWPIIEETVDFDDKTNTPEQRYLAVNGRLVVTTPPEGRKIQQFWTQKEFPNDFVLRLEFRATPNADSGIFIRGKQLQCRDFLLAGPYKKLKKYKPQDWNEVTIVVRGQSAYCTCNGEVLEEAFQVPPTGPIGLEGDRGQMEYRRIRYKEIHNELPRSSPESQGISSAGLLKYVDELDKIDAVHGLMVLRHGSVVAEGWWAPFQRNDPHQLYSLSKSFTSTAVGMAIAEGKFSLDDTVVSFFHDRVPQDASYNLKGMRVRDLLTMSTGHDSQDLKKFDFLSDENKVKAFLELPVAHNPGTHFLYNTPATYMCSAIVQKSTGQTVLEYLKSRLFEPLQISNPTWSEADGISHGGFGLNVRTEDIARFGQLYLQRGQWQGKQLLPSEWVQQATSKQVANGSNPASDWNQGYGFQFWRCRHGFYRGDGAFGQFCIVMPEHDMVVAINSGTNNMGKIMQVTWDHLLPAIQAEPLAEDHRSVQKLKNRLRTLQLPTVVGQATTASSPPSGKYQFGDNDLGLKTLDVNFEKNTIKCSDSKGTYRLAIGKPQWLRQRVPSVGPLVSRIPNAKDVGVATSSAWTKPNTYHVRAWLYESPFRVDLSLEFLDDKLTLTVDQNVNFGPKHFELQGTREQ